jgi:hypothetical protein
LWDARLFLRGKGKLTIAEVVRHPCFFYCVCF